MTSLPISSNANWQLSKLRHESDDVIIELLWQNQVLKIVIETHKSIHERECQNLEQVQQELMHLLGKKRVQKIVNNWHEISYRKIPS